MGCSVFLVNKLTVKQLWSEAFRFLWSDRRNKAVCHLRRTQRPEAGAEAVWWLRLIVSSHQVCLGAPRFLMMPPDQGFMIIYLCLSPAGTRRPFSSCRTWYPEKPVTAASRPSCWVLCLSIRWIGFIFQFSLLPMQRWALTASAAAWWRRWPPKPSLLSTLVRKHSHTVWAIRTRPSNIRL